MRFDIPTLIRSNNFEPVKMHTKNWVPQQNWDEMKLSGKVHLAKAFSAKPSVRGAQRRDII